MLDLLILIKNYQGLSLIEVNLSEFIETPLSIKDILNDSNELDKFRDYFLILMDKCNCDKLRQSTAPYQWLREVSIQISNLEYSLSLLNSNELSIEEKSNLENLELERTLYYSVAFEHYLKRIIDDNFYKLYYKRYVPKDLYEFGKHCYKIRVLPNYINYLNIDNIDSKTLDTAIKHSHKILLFLENLTPSDMYFSDIESFIDLLQEIQDKLEKYSDNEKVDRLLTLLVKIEVELSFLDTRVLREL